MAIDQYRNLAVGTVATVPAPPASGTTCALTAGQGSAFPPAPFNATVWPQGALPMRSNAEIVRVTAMSGDSITAMTRAQEGTTARTILAGDFLAATLTQKFVSDLADASNLTAGALPDARLSANVARRDLANTFVADNITPQVFQGATSGRLYLKDPSQPVDQRVVQAMNVNGTYVVHWVNDAITAQISPTPLQLDRNGGHLHVGGDLYEKLRAVPMGHWQTLAYSAGNYTAAAGTWTVEAADVTMHGYTVIGKTLLVSFTLLSTSVSQATNQLRIAIPGFTVGQNFVWPGLNLANAGAAWVSTGAIAGTAGNGYLELRADPTSAVNWAVGTNNTSVIGMAFVPLA